MVETKVNSLVTIDQGGQQVIDLYAMSIYCYNNKGTLSDSYYNNEILHSGNRKENIAHIIYS